MYQDIKALQSVITRLCQEKGITINKLATLSNVTQSTIDSIMKGKSKNPKIETLRKISQGFDLDYDEFILLINSAQDEINPKPTNMDTDVNIDIAIRIQNLRKLRNLTQKDVASHLGIAERSYQRYESGERQPDLDVLVKLADFLDTSVDYLLGRESKLYFLDKHFDKILNVIEEKSKDAPDYVNTKDLYNEYVKLLKNSNYLVASFKSFFLPILEQSIEDVRFEDGEIKVYFKDSKLND